MNQRDISEYCKPFVFEQLVIDSDDIVKIAIIVARKLLDGRIDEVSISTLQAISDIKEPLEDSQEDHHINFKKLRDEVQKKMDEKLDSINDLFASEDYEPADLNKIMIKVHHYVRLIEEYNLKEKLSYKRALSMCLILLKQCRTDVTD